MTTLAQDPNELIDVVTAHGEPTGIVKRRRDVHRDGDWHRAVHVWIYGVDNGVPFLMAQRRGHDKDTWPGSIDATAAGHLAAGESPQDAFREIEEELGIVPALASLRHVGTRIIADEAPDRMDREHEEVYLLRDDRPIIAYHPNAVEVDGILRVPLEGWLPFVFGDRGEIQARLLVSTSREEHEIRITMDQLIPSPDRYYQRVAVACLRALNDERYVVV